MAATALSLAALSAVVSAQTGSFQTKPTLPLNSQIGAFQFPINCTVFGLPLNVDGYYTATAPVYAAPGQQVYYTDATAMVKIPPFITNAGSLVGVDHADVVVNVAIDVENATPTTQQAFPTGLAINDLELKFGQTLIVPVPPTGFIPPIGPFTMGAAGLDNNIFLGDVRVDVTLYNKKGKKLITAPVLCPALKQPVDLGSVNIGGPASTEVLKPSIGERFNFPPIVDNQEVGYYHIDYSCDIGPLTDIPVDLVFGGQLFSGYQAGSSFDLTNITAFLNVPQAFINAAKQLYQASTFTTTVNSVGITLSNASPSSANALKSPISLTVKAPSTGGLNLKLPAGDGVLTAGPFKAGPNAGQFMVLGLGNSLGNVAIKNAAGATTFSGALSCKPNQKTDLYAILINPVKGTKTTSSGTATGTPKPGAVCFDAGDCLLSGGGKCVRKGASIVGHCVKN